MTSAVPMIISDKNFKQIFGFAEANSALAKNLYNAALFESARYSQDGIKLKGPIMKKKFLKK